MHLRQWAHARRFERLPGVGKLGNSLLGNDPILGMECGFHTRLRQALPERVSDIDRIRRICGERDYRQTDEQEAANEVEPTYVQAFIEVASTFSMEHWRTNSAIGIRASDQSYVGPRLRYQLDHPTTLRALDWRLFIATIFGIKRYPAASCRKPAGVSAETVGTPKGSKTW